MKCLLCTTHSRKETRWGNLSPLGVAVCQNTPRWVPGDVPTLLASQDLGRREESALVIPKSAYVLSRTLESILLSGLV